MCAAGGLVYLLCLQKIVGLWMPLSRHLLRTQLWAQLRICRSAPAAIVMW
jgi:hypothetical protein